MSKTKMINLQNINSSNKFSRYEMKYILKKDSNLIIEEIKNFMIYDGYAAKKVLRVTLLDLFILIARITQILMKKSTA